MSERSIMSLEEMNIDCSISPSDTNLSPKERPRPRIPRWLRRHPNAPLPGAVLRWYRGRPSFLKLDYEQPDTITVDHKEITFGQLRQLLGDLTELEMHNLYSIFTFLIKQRPYLLAMDLEYNPIHNRVFCAELTRRLKNDSKVIDGAGFWGRILLARLEWRKEVEWGLYLVAWRAWYCCVVEYERQKRDNGEDSDEMREAD
ncbi:hypothetical protein TWF694_000234 [Orbilia ellipsospora]|uniref:Uncharacterized protein n=1 Tax=Orbilia ellipsospora TaxID=2528407 RepID=A0AAV9XN14_9PEZI